jgi:membrane protein DedA with SNARE-associated domain
MEQLAELLNALTTFIDSLTQLITDSPITYLLIFALAAFDVIFPLLPAEASVTAAAVLAGQGKLSIVTIVVAAGLGAFVGDNIAYWIGRFAGRPVVVRILRGDTTRLESAEEQFRKQGGMFVIVGRFIPGGRTATAIGAGVLHFSWPKFVAYDALAAVVWAFQAALPGFIGGRLISDKPWLALLFGFVLSATLAVSIYLLQRWRSRTRPDVIPVRPAVVGIERIHRDPDSDDEAPRSDPDLS